MCVSQYDEKLLLFPSLLPAYGKVHCCTYVLFIQECGRECVCLQVSFEKHVSVGGEEKGGDGEGEKEEKVKVVKKTLFQRSNLYPQKKVLTFNRYSDDFTFSVYYSHLGFLNEEEKMYAIHRWGGCTQ